MERKIINFWCNRCRIDWKVIAVRKYKNHIYPDVWEAQCESCGGSMIRLVNDAKRDPYFRLSRKAQVERKKYAKDLIDMNNPMFDVLYPQYKKERMEREKQEELEKWKELQNKK